VPGIEAHIFGSALTSGEPRDIDLVLIYDVTRVTVTQAIEVRKKVCDGLVQATGIPADVVLLSSTEAEETKFLSKIHTVRVL